MNTRLRIALILCLLLLAAIALVVVTQAAPGLASRIQGGAPTTVAYQGQVNVGNAPYTGDGYFKLGAVSPISHTSKAGETS
jgi:hypothetical protein